MTADRSETTLRHPDAETFELYVMDALDGDEARALEAHAKTCATCAATLAREARFEDRVRALAHVTVFCPGCGRITAEARCVHCGAAMRAGAYTLHKVLVQNAHGRIYLARDAEGRRVALKELAFVRAPGVEEIDAFEREARVLRQLRHPAIPAFIDSFVEGEGVHTRMYLAQEFIEGQSLAARLAERQLDEQEARAIADEVLGILEYLQGLSPMVFHRDIKPANLIRRPDGSIALVDFGAARDLGATVGATLVGTFGYMPVEQMGGIVDATSDLYALGATLAHLLSRREPWKLLEDAGALERLNVSEPLRAWIGRLVARRREERFGGAKEARAALHGLGRGRAHRFPMGFCGWGDAEAGAWGGLAWGWRGRRMLTPRRLRLRRIFALMMGTAVAMAMAFMTTVVRPRRSRAPEPQMLAPTPMVAKAPVLKAGPVLSVATWIEPLTDNYVKPDAAIDRDAVSACFAPMREGPAAKGEIVVTVTFQPTGKVAAAQAFDHLPEALPAAVRDCVVRLATSAKYPTTSDRRQGVANLHFAYARHVVNATP